MKWVVLLLVVLLVELYAYQALRQLTSRKIWKIAYVLVTLGAFLYLGYGIAKFDRSLGQNHQTMLGFAMVILVFVPKLLVALLMIGEDVVRLCSGIYRYAKSEVRTNHKFMPGRRKFVSQMAYGLASIPFISIWNGITIGRYKFQVHKQTLFFEDLPEAFDGFTFTQISDIHCGSFDNEEKIKHAIDLINAQESDMLLFTGDLVNSIASEMNPWMKLFQNIRSYPLGKFSILGNHDYGDYVHWPTEEEKKKNFQAIKQLHPEMGFQLLLNEHVWIEREGARIALIGVENWGVNFKKRGDLQQASEGVRSEDFKILMTHDPSHWDAQIVENTLNYQLTLAGHTHGSQFGIEIPGVIKWSPIQYVYKQWAGLYEKMGRFLYVNRGFGYHAYRGRVGIWPEVTVFELKKRKK